MGNILCQYEFLYSSIVPGFQPSVAPTRTFLQIHGWPWMPPCKPSAAVRHDVLGSEKTYGEVQQTSVESVTVSLQYLERCGTSRYLWLLEGMMYLCNELHQLGPLWIFMEVSFTLYNYLFAPGLSEMNVTHPSWNQMAFLFSIRMGPVWKGSQPQNIKLKHSLYLFWWISFHHSV